MLGGHLFDPKQIAKAIGRLPSQSNAEIRIVRTNAVGADIHDLVNACDRELKLRGGLELSPQQAREAVEASKRVHGRPLPDVVRAAFLAIPAKDYEIALIRTIHANADAPFPEIEKAYGRKDTALVVGHLVYDRFGFFRQFLDLEKDQSSILVMKGRSGSHVTWRLKDETVAVFEDLRIL
jgi:hypothetical protein